MRKLKDEYGDPLYIGTAREILNTWKHLAYSETCVPSHCGVPKFNFTKTYGLSVNYDDTICGLPIMMVVSESTICSMLRKGVI